MIIIIIGVRECLKLFYSILHCIPCRYFGNAGFFIFLGNFKYYLVLHSSMENISLKLERNFLNAIMKVMKKHNYVTKTEFIREAVRDKIRMLEEKEIIEDKDVFNQILESEKNIKKGKIKEFKC